MTLVLSSVLSQLLLLQAKLRAVEEERLILREDADGDSLDKESLIRNAWTSRDKAEQKKNMAEVELARERIEEMQVENIQNKILI